MQRTVLRKGERLWAQGQPATTVAVIESGKLGVWSDDNRLMGIAFPNMVLGESSLLATPNEPMQRTASVLAVEDDTAVTEYPPALVREAFGAGVPRLVLRMLCGQICRNALLTLAANDSPVVESTLRSLIDTARTSERLSKEVSDWTGFMASLRVLYHLRDGTNAIRESLCADATEAECAAMILRASKIMKDLFKVSDIAPMLEDFLEAERLQRTAANISAGLSH